MKKVFSLVLMVSLSFTLAACQKAPQGDPQAIIDKAWEKMAEKNSGYKSGKIKVKGKGNLEVEGNKAEISGTGDVLFDNTDEKNVKTAMKLDLNANGELEGQKGTVAFKGEIRVLEKILYLFVENVNIDTGDAQTNMMANLIGNLYKSQWISLPSDTVDTPEAVGLESFTGEKMSEIAKKHHFIEASQDLGDGKFEVVINVEKLKAYLSEIATANETPLETEDLAAIDNFFKTISYMLQVQIDDEYDLTWAKGNISGKDEEENQEVMLSFEGTTDDNVTDGTLDLVMSGTTPGKLRLELNIEHEEQSVTIEKPADAQEFDPGALLGGGMGMGGEMEGLPEGMTPEMMMGLPQ